MVPRFALLALLFLATAATARPYGVDDLLALEGLGPAAVDPSGRWLVVETREAYDHARRYDYDGHMAFALGRLAVADLARPGPARPLLPAAPGTGYLAGPFSPSGRAMVVFRHRGATWEMGVVGLEDGRATWLGIAPDLSDLGRAVQWRSEHELVAIALEDGGQPQSLRVGSQAAARLPALWRRSAAGRESAFTAVGAGRYAGAGPAAPTRRLLRLDLATGQAVELARDGFLDLELSRDGRFVAALAAAEPIPPPAQGPARMGDPDRRRDLVIVDLATGEAWRPRPGRDTLWALLSWSPAGDSLLVFDRDARQGWESGGFIRIDAVPRTAEPLAAGGLVPDIAWTPEVGLPLAHAAWLGGAPGIRARPGASARADWFRLGAGPPLNLTAQFATPPAAWPADDAGRPVLAADGALWRLEDGGELRRLPGNRVWPWATAREPGAGLRATVNPPRPTGDIWAARTTPARIEARDLAGRRLAVSIVPGATPLAMARRGLVLQARDVHGVTTLSLARPGHPTTALLTLNAQLAALEVAEPRPIVHAGPDGRRLTSWLYLPPGAARGRAPPLIVLPYPGAVYDAPPYTGQPDALALSASPQVLAARGYAVLVPSLPRSKGSTEPAAGITGQILAIVDQVVAAGLADGERLALWGHSFGGYGALVAATETDRFKAIIAANGVSDLTSLRGTFPPAGRVAPEDGPTAAALAGWSESGQGGLATTPWEDPQRYVANSPVFAARRVRTPLLLIHGDQDFVGLGQSEEMFSALWRQDKDVELITFWGEGHVVASPANVRALYAAVFSFLDGLIGPPPTPDARSAPPTPAPRPRQRPGP